MDAVTGVPKMQSSPLETTGQRLSRKKRYASDSQVEYSGYHMETWVHEMDYDQSEQQGIQDEYNEESMSSSSSRSSDIYVRGPDLMEMLEPIHDALDSSQAAEDTLFEHIGKNLH